MDKTSQNIYIFNDEDKNMSFREFRRRLAEKTDPNILEDNSNMETIDKLLKDYNQASKLGISDLKTWTTIELQKLNKEVDKLISSDANDNSITIGGGLSTVPTFKFNDGLGSKIENGILYFQGAVLSQFLKFKHYTVEETIIDDIPHLRLTYTR